jgi:superfamily II DNA or RNA helicase/HKD family nuclease
MHLPDGLYDTFVTESLAKVLASRIREACQTSMAPRPEDSAERLAEALGRQITELLDGVAGQEREKTLRQLALVNGLLAYLRQQAGTAAQAVDLLSEPPRLLHAVHRRGPAPEWPETGLSFPWLFTAGKGSPSLLTELRHELGSCDQVDILVSFITVSGVRKILDLLQSVTAVNAVEASRTRLRVLTTTYTGATEKEALDYLASLPGCEVRVSLDGRRTRLHAKAWIFQRRTGYGSAYVGSANLSGAALLGGLEWTVKFTEQGQRALYERAKAHFETLWNDSEFQQYDPANPKHRSELVRALKRESGETLTATTTFFDLQPKDYQKEMLEQLALEREHGRMRNLIVAATGTGKTVVAAFDYRATCDALGGRPRLLFVAHRREILVQARRTYREVLRDHSFGELLADGLELQGGDHVFATIDSLHVRNLVAQRGANFWDTVVVDECHRLAAERFDGFVRSVQPRVLLGLTATPERSDGRPIFTYFDSRPDGAPAVELRLWHALELQLLCPFEYYGCDDDTDFSDVPWDKPGERDALDKIVTGNDVRARLVVDEWTRLTANPRRSKTLAFCVSVAHAEFMTRKFNEAGLPAVCVLGSTDPEIRRQAPDRLQRGDVCAIVTCDLYNEGVDLPFVDTLLLLRPTQSPVLFQQQIGRGLRLHGGKESCLVLDFVGRYRTDFRFDRLLSALTGLSRGQVMHAVEKGFSSLPPGCHIQLQAQARERILQGLRGTINQSWRRLRAELQSYVALRGRSNVQLAGFLREQGLQLEDIYREHGVSGWTALRREAGLLSTAEAAEEAYFGRRLSDLLHVDDPEQVDLMVRLGAGDVRYEALSSREQRRLELLVTQVDSQRDKAGTVEAFLERLKAAPEVLEELGEFGGVLQSRTMLRARPIAGLEDVPLCLHAGYRIREILTAVGWITPEQRRPFQAGVLALHDRKVELLFVTLDKSEGYHDRIAYHDYAISSSKFHWQSQNSASPETAAGRRYLESPGNGWTFQLFVRPNKDAPYRACGPVTLEQAEGAKPMSIIWNLAVPLPTKLFQEFSVLRGA